MKMRVVQNGVEVDVPENVAPIGANMYERIEFSEGNITLTVTQYPDTIEFEIDDRRLPHPYDQCVEFDLKPDEIDQLIAKLQEWKDAKSQGTEQGQ